MLIIIKYNNSIINFVYIFIFKFISNLNIVLIIPLVPASIENTYILPTHQMSIEKSFTCPPACTTVKHNLLVRVDVKVFPLFFYLVRAFNCSIWVMKIFHTIRVSTWKSKLWTFYIASILHVGVTTFKTEILWKRSNTY